MTGLCINYVWVYLGARITIESLLTMKNLVPEQLSGAHLASRQVSDGCRRSNLWRNMRVGLEDNLYMSRGIASNAALVARAVAVEAVGGRVANVEDARRLLKL